MAARGRTILITALPQGRFLEGTIFGTPKPGTVMSMKDAFYEGGWHRWEPWSYSSGHRRLIAVLLENRLLGGTIDDAHVSGTRGLLYCPIAGEEMNMLIADLAGTGANNTHAVFEQLMVQTATGKLIVESSPESEPFTLLEAITTTDADVHAPCMYTGQ
jgi:hypothetical protein